MTIKEPNFEQAMQAATLWCNSWEKGELSDEVLAERVEELLESRAGARGFFVIILATDCPLIDRLPESILIKLRCAGEKIIDLTVRNLAMSSAMAIHHQRKNDLNSQNLSERITRRCIEVLRELEPNSVKDRLEQLIEGINGIGRDVEFLEKWEYDLEQKQAISNNILKIAEN